MSKKSKDVIGEIFEHVKGDNRICTLHEPLLKLWQDNRWDAEAIAQVTEEVHKAQ